jgi:hypothetical protein
MSIEPRSSGDAVRRSPSAATATAAGAELIDLVGQLAVGTTSTESSGARGEGS